MEKRTQNDVWNERTKKLNQNQMRNNAKKIYIRYGSMNFTLVFSTITECDP